MKQVVDELRRVQPPEALVTGPDRRYRYGRARFCPADEPLAVALASETALTALKQPRFKQLSTTIDDVCAPGGHRCAPPDQRRDGSGQHPQSGHGSHTR
jgi:hypothetical protein